MLGKYKNFIDKLFTRQLISQNSRRAVFTAEPVINRRAIGNRLFIRFLSHRPSKQPGALHPVYLDITCVLNLLRMMNIDSLYNQRKKELPRKQAMYAIYIAIKYPYCLCEL